jgi:tetratricopeptide (TPR) repeat protein
MGNFVNMGTDWDDIAASNQDDINHAYAQCFQKTKEHDDGNYKDIIETCSKVLVAKKAKEPEPENEVLCIRAYAYYLNGEYAKAITDCEKIIELDASDRWKSVYDELDKLLSVYSDSAKEKQTVDTENEKPAANESLITALNNISGVFPYEMLGMIYSKLDYHLEAKRNYEKALIIRQQSLLTSSPLLMDAYRDACKKIS